MNTAIEVRPQSGRHAGGITEGMASARVVVLAGRFEARRLCRNPLVVACLVVAAALIWWNSRLMVPQWWVWDVQIGSILLLVAGAVLVAAQFAAGRVRRDGAAHLYESYPASASARVAAHLVGLFGPLFLAAMLAGAAVGWLDVLGPVGTPRLNVLAQGLLLVALGGAVGVALGSYLPHPLAGVLAVIMIGSAEAGLLLPFGGPVQLPGGTVWLFPWDQPVVLRWLPGPIPIIPPTAHLAWLAALTALAVFAALWRAAGRRRVTWRTGAVALAAVGSLAAVGWSGWVQTRPVPASVQDSLLYQTTNPAHVERCISLQRVSYCVYPGFGPDVARWAAVVNGVLGRVPKRPGKALVVRQVVDVDVYAAPLYVGYQPTAIGQVNQLHRLASELGKFVNAQSYDPHLVPGSSVPPVYVDMNWGAGSDVGSYQLGLAMQTAWWVTGLPTTWQRSVWYGGPGFSTQAQISCLPVGQAREAIALWLAASATPATRPVFLAGLQSEYGGTPAKVGRTWISRYTGVPTPTSPGYLPALQFTGQGAVLAKAMLRLPQRRIEAVLAARWPGWLSPRATDAQLAAALRIPLPAAPSAHVSAFDRGQPTNPVCQ